MKLKIVVIILSLFLGLCSLHAMGQNAHFWDGIEAFDGPTDENPVLAAQLDFYFDKMVAPLPDSITNEIDRLVEQTSFNTDLRDFILWHLLEKYRHPEYMSQDQVFVWLYDHYFSQLEIKDLNETNLSLIREKAERLRRLALSNTAPDFKLNDSIDLQSVESEYTVLFFYDHDCDVCHQEMQELDSVCVAHPEITVLSIDMNTDDTRVDALYDLYDIETTPLIYVLDRDKRIMAKKIRARQIPWVTASRF
ncbi:MAG: redoxin domain-containing protein [bacterium]|nr:redoxin domain-containing protein [bacterium]